MQTILLLLLSLHSAQEIRDEPAPFTLKPLYLQDRQILEPKIIRDVVQGEPLVKEQTLTIPQFTHIIGKPVVLERNIKADASLSYAPDVYKDVVTKILPTKETVSQNVKTVTVPGNKIESFTTIKPTQHTIYEREKLVQQNQTVDDVPLFQPNVKFLNVKTKTVQKPDFTIFHQKELQNVIDREKIDLFVKDGELTYRENPAIVNPTIEKTSKVIQQETVPGMTSFYQNSVYPETYNEKLKINYFKQPDQVKDLPTIFEEPVMNVKNDQKIQTYQVPVPEYQDNIVRIPVTFYTPQIEDKPVYYKLPTASEYWKNKYLEEYSAKRAADKAAEGRRFDYNDARYRLCDVIIEQDYPWNCKEFSKPCRRPCGRAY